MSVLVDIKTGDPESAAARYQTVGYMLAYNEHASDQIAFEPEMHVYRHKESGLSVPGVTSILLATGVSTDFETLSNLKHSLKHAIALKRDIGKALHADAHAFDDHDIDWSTVHDDVRRYLDCWVTFRENYAHLRPATRERIVYHPNLRFAGTLDAIFLQDSETDIAISERWSVQLCPDKKMPYRVTPYPDHYGDQLTFKAIVACYYAGVSRRIA